MHHAHHVCNWMGHHRSCNAIPKVANCTDNGHTSTTKQLLIDWAYIIDVMHACHSIADNMHLLLGVAGYCLSDDVTTMLTGQSLQAEVQLQCRPSVSGTLLQQLLSDWMPAQSYMQAQSILPFCTAVRDNQCCECR